MGLSQESDCSPLDQKVCFKNKMDVALALCKDGPPFDLPVSLPPATTHPVGMKNYPEELLYIKCINFQTVA